MGSSASALGSWRLPLPLESIVRRVRLDGGYRGRRNLDSGARFGLVLVS